MEIDPVNSRLTAIEGKISGIESRLGAMEVDVKSIHRVAKWIAGIISVVGLAVCYAIYGLAETKVREIARAVVREELAYKATTTQQGRFTAKTRISDRNGHSFAWVLHVPVDDPDKLIMLVAEPLEPLPGIAVSAKLSDDGKACIMTLHGDEQTLTHLPDSIDAKVVISTRQ
jgi:hypothetical protein